MSRYVDIVLPLGLPPMTYEVPDEMSGDISVGQGVQVQLGRNKIYMGVVWRLHDSRPPFKTVRSIGPAVRGEVLVNTMQRRLWQWMSDYYMSPLGDVMRAALPAALKPSAMSEQEFGDEIYRLPTERCVRFGESVVSEEALHKLIESIPKRAAKQYEAVMKFCSRFEGFDSMSAGEVRVADLGFSPQVVDKVVGRGIFKLVEREVELGAAYDACYRLSPLSSAQKQALERIEEQFADKSTVLLHGITGSGKTEIYSHLIAAELARGGSVLYLLPEIAITKQLIERMESFFGDRVTVYHSKLTIHQRTQTYLRMCHSRGGELVMGVRSSLFLPVPNLRLVIVDEEHDCSFKQDDPSPRYSARDCAVWMAREEGIRCLLGSGTPSVESYYNAQSGRYGLVSLSERYGQGRLPSIVLSDTLRNVRRGERHSHFNKELLDRLERCLADGRQAILFQNRRGFAPYVECTDCGWVAQCPSCSVTLTLHKAEGKLRCHYCGYSQSVPHLCPSCRVAEPVPQGFGTEKIEEEIAKIFPQARVARLDSDSASSPAAYRRIIDDFEAQRTDILIGTQMITKGFDFSGVTLVGVLNADNLLRMPNFRAAERAYQTITQVAGRAGRTDGDGEVVVQTAEPLNVTLMQVVRGDYLAMLDCQLAERRPFFYPPFGRMIEVTLRYHDPKVLSAAAGILADGLRNSLPRSVTGPHPPAIERIAGEYMLEILLKVPAGESFAAAKSLLKEQIAIIAADKRYRPIIISCNVDPQ